MTYCKIMGILNVTPDSFFDGGQFNQTKKAIEQGVSLWSEGADIIDIGGESTRPGSISISLQEELDRTIPVIEALSKKVEIPLSIDTSKPEVAKEGVKAGASIINDISGFRSADMIQVAVNTGATVCAMHMQGTPKTMQEAPSYKEGVVQDILLAFKQIVKTLTESGIEKEKIILDPGMGFGKTVEDNCKILHNLHKFTALGFPLLIGISRKSFMGSVVNEPPEHLLPTTIAMNTIAILSSAAIIRVHDVKEHKMVRDILQRFIKSV